MKTLDDEQLVREVLAPLTRVEPVQRRPALERPAGRGWLAATLVAALLALFVLVRPQPVSAPRSASPATPPRSAAARTARAATPAPPVTIAAVRSWPHVSTLRAGQVNTVKASPHQAYVVTVANRTGRLVRGVAVSLDLPPALNVWIASIRPRATVRLPLTVRQPLPFDRVVRVSVTVRIGTKVTSRASYRVRYVAA
jgi:hypothetical protein